MAATADRAFTAEALVTLVEADRWAERTSAGTIGPNHLLLALLEPVDGSVRDLLAAIGVDGDALARFVETRTTGPSAGSQRAVFDLAAKGVIERAVDEARGLGAPRINDVHLFLGLLGGAKEVVPPDLAEAGLTLEAARAQAGMVARRPAFAVQRLRSAGLTLDAARSEARRLTGQRVGVVDRLRAMVASPDGLRRPARRRAQTGRRVSRRSPSNPGALIEATRPSPVFFGILLVVLWSGMLLLWSVPGWAVRPLTVLFLLGGWVASLCVHEYGHAAAAYLGGDRGVVEQGYLTLDPRRYTNPFLSFVVPALFLLLGSIPMPGGAVMLSRSRLSSWRWDYWVSAGGPLGTLACLVVVGVPFLIGGGVGGYEAHPHFWAAFAGLASVEATSLVLNLLPIPPLDGFKLATHWMPAQVREAGRRLDWLPLLGLYWALSQDTPISDAFWGASRGLAGLFGVPDWLGGSALRMLSLW